MSSANVRVLANAIICAWAGRRCEGELKPDAVAAASLPQADPVLESDYARCAEITRRASSNFYYAFMLLPRERRRALYAVYAFCRFVDDIADDDRVKHPAEMLTRWREELDRVFAGTPSRAISRALSEN